MYCRGQLVQLQHDLPAFERAGIGLAAISYDSPAVLKDFAARKGISFPLLADHDSKVIHAFGVANRRYRPGMLLDLNTEQITDSPGDVPVFGVAYPSVFLTGPHGEIRWRFVSEADELRLTGAAILQRSVNVATDTVRQPIPNARVQVSITAGNSDARLGNRLQIAVELKLPPRYHLYGHDVRQPYRGLDWKMDASSCWYQTDAAYPDPARRRFAYEPEPLPVYENSVRLTRELVLKPVLSAADPSLYRLFQKVCLDSGNVKAAGSLAIQVCDDRQCYPPESLPLEWKFRFVPPDLDRAPAELRREFEP